MNIPFDNDNDYDVMKYELIKTIVDEMYCIDFAYLITIIQ